MLNPGKSFAIGQHIRDIRKAKRKTIKDVTAELADYGYTINQSAYSRMELGQQTIPIELASAIADVLGVSLDTIADRDCLGDRIELELSHLTQHQRDVVEYIFTKWHGDYAALIEFLALYVSVEPQSRADISGMGLHIYDRETTAGNIIEQAPSPDIEYLRAAWAEIAKLR